MKRIVTNSLLLVLLAMASSLAPSETHTYTTDNGNFSIVFPSEYKTSEKVTDGYITVKAQATSGEMVFFAAYTLHNSSLTDTEELNNVAVDSFLKRLEGKPSGKKKWKVKKHKGLKTKFTSETKKVIGEYRALIVGQTQYQITAVGPKDAWDAKKVKKFLKSFKLKK